jgi:hypothetical protein
VFRGAGVKKDPYRDAGDVSALSNVITLTILPDDPEWDTARLKESFAVLDEENAGRTLREDASRRARSFESHHRLRALRFPTPAARRYLDAQEAIDVLDTRKPFASECGASECPLYASGPELTTNTELFTIPMLRE